MKHNHGPDLDHDCSPQHNVPPDEAEALHHFRANIGMNFDGSFGSLWEDTAARDIADTFREHQPPDE